MIRLSAHLISIEYLFEKALVTKIATTLSIKAQLKVFKIKYIF